MSTNSHKGCCDKCKRECTMPGCKGKLGHTMCVNPVCECHKDRVEGPVYKTSEEEVKRFVEAFTVKPYNQTDHYHCWEKDEDEPDAFPPCGQKIEHLKCCLCEVPNPKGILEGIRMCKNILLKSGLEVVDLKVENGHLWVELPAKVTKDVLTIFDGDVVSALSSLEEKINKKTT